MVKSFDPCQPARTAQVHWVITFCRYINCLPDVKIFGFLSRFKASAGNNFNMAQMVQFLFDRVENIVGKGDNPGDQHCLLLPLYFQKVSFPKPKKSALCTEMLSSFFTEYDSFIFGLLGTTYAIFRVKGNSCCHGYPFPNYPFFFFQI